MSLVNGSQGQHGSRPNAQSVTQPQTQWGHPSAPQTAAPAAGYAQQGQGYAPQYGGQPQQAAAPGYGQTPGQTPSQAPVYGQTQDYHFPQGAAAQDPHYGGLQQNAYAPQFEPYVAAPQAAPRAGQPVYQQQAAAPAYAPQAHQSQAHQGYGAAPQAAHPQTQWPSQQAQQQDGRGFDLGSYLPHQQPALGGYRGEAQHQEPQQQDWSHQAGYQGETGHGDMGHGDMGFAQAAGGELEQGYADEEAQEYDAEPAPRGRRPLMMVAALAGAIVVGSGMAYSYKTFFGGSSVGDPPIIKSANEPAKIKPVDGGGKQFAHTDSKIMGRLGDGSGAAAGETAGADSASASAGDVDAGGTRKVSTLVVGRDGSIQAPPAAPAEAQVADNSITVPGMTVVDGLGPARAPAAAATMAAVTPAAPAPAKAAAPAAAPQKLVVAPPAAPAKAVTIAKATPAAVAAATGSIEPDAQAAPAPPAKPVKKVAVAKPAAAAPAAAAAAAPAAATAPVSNSVATTGSGANGFVAVLASVPRSDSSRIDALKRFADMQQKYGSVLGGKTPDVAEANLGAKGAYHRLVVGPPGSREQAGAVCSQLKTQGYGDCWVTSY